MNEVVPKDRVIPVALEWASRIVENSPDSVQATKRALLMANQIADVEELVVKHAQTKEMLRLYGGDNMKVPTEIYRGNMPFLTSAQFRSVLGRLRK